MQGRQYSESLWPALQSGVNLAGGALCSGKPTTDRISFYLPDVASTGRMTVKHGVGNMLSVQKKQRQSQNTRPPSGLSHSASVLLPRLAHSESTASPLGGITQEEEACAGPFCAFEGTSAPQGRQHGTWLTVVLKTWGRWTQPQPSIGRDCMWTSSWLQGRAVEDGHHPGGGGAQEVGQVTACQWQAWDGGGLYWAIYM